MPAVQQRLDELRAQGELVAQRGRSDVLGEDPVEVVGAHAGQGGEALEPHGVGDVLAQVGPRARHHLRLVPAGRRVDASHVCGDERDQAPRRLPQLVVPRPGRGGLVHRVDRRAQPRVVDDGPCERPRPVEGPAAAERELVEHLGRDVHGAVVRRPDRMPRVHLVRSGQDRVPGDHPPPARAERVRLHARDQVADGPLVVHVRREGAAEVTRVDELDSVEPPGAAHHDALGAPLRRGWGRPRPLRGGARRGRCFWMIPAAHDQSEVGGASCIFLCDRGADGRDLSAG